MRNIYVDQQLFPNQTIGDFIQKKERKKQMLVCKYFSLSIY